MLYEVITGTHVVDVAAVDRADAAAQALDDLLRDREAEARMGAELLARRALGVESYNFV